MGSASIKKGTVGLIGLSCLGILILVGIILFSPLATQFSAGLGRGVSNEAEVDALIEAGQFQDALYRVESKIVENSKDLPRIAYLDRYLPAEKRYETSLARLEIYELQWKRIEILSAMGSKENLRKALKDYTSVIGYHQEAAKEMLNQLEDR